MILSQNRIKRYITEQKITIAPFEPANLKASSLTLTLSNNFELNGGLALKERFVLPAKNMCVGYTKEKITLSSSVCAQLSARNSFVRMGLQILFGDTFCESDTNTNLSVMIYNCTDSDVILKAGTPFIKIVFLDVK
jgi:deoxycytidine triphosphate deaminase